MVGSFYVAANPDAKPFVRVGDRVNPETVVCVIEAMKVFNEIKAEVSGVIEKVAATTARRSSSVNVVPDQAVRKGDRRQKTEDRRTGGTRPGWPPADF